MAIKFKKHQKKRLSKKAQLEMGESIIVLIIFLFLVVFGVVFYAKIQKFTGDKQAVEQQDEINIQIEQKIRYLAEIQCTINGVVRFDCYDLAKLKAFKTTYGEHSLYYDTTLFHGANVNVTSVYPDSFSFFLLGEETVDDTITGETPYNTPVVLYNGVTDQYNFGYITVLVPQR
jgi:hypothetical protein